MAIKTEEELKAIKAKFLEKKEKLKPDDARVAIAEMQLNALLQLADDSNEIFSQVDGSEIFDISRAIVFADNCLPSTSEKLKAIGINHIFKLPVLTQFIKENFRQRHKTDRLRVDEILKGMENISSKDNFMSKDDNQKKTMLSRMI